MTQNNVTAASAAEYAKRAASPVSTAPKAKASEKSAGTGEETLTFHGVSKGGHQTVWIGGKNGRSFRYFEHATLLASGDVPAAFKAAAKSGDAEAIVASCDGRKLTVTARWTS